MAKHPPCDHPRRAHDLGPRRAVLVYDDAGEPRYWQGLSFNITDRTTAELEATRRLAALDELRNSMLTAISHELRTPLAGILGASVALECAGGRMSE